MNLTIEIRCKYCNTTRTLTLDSWCALTPLCEDYGILRKYNRYIYNDGSMIKFYFTHSLFTKESSILYQVYTKLKEHLEKIGIVLPNVIYYNILKTLFKDEKIKNELAQNYISKDRHVNLSGIHSNQDDEFDKILQL